MRTLNIARANLLMKFPRARAHRLEDGRWQIINPVGGGQFESLGYPTQSSREAWVVAKREQMGDEG